MINISFVLIILGIFQGITEFLPISSSGHLALLEQTDTVKNLMGDLSDEMNLLINVSLHIATLLAVVLYMRKEIFIIIKGFFTGLIKRDFSNQDFLSGIYIIIASIPAGVLGFCFHKHIEAIFSSVTIILIFLIINGFILIAANKIPSKDRKFKELGIFRSIMIGLCQAVALLPGISRSGSTLAGGLLCGLEGVEAARFSFLMAIPVIAGAGLLEGLKAAKGSYPSDIFLPILAGMLAAFIVALAAIRILFWIVKNVRLDIFGFYTIALGVSGLIIKFLIIG